MDEVGRKPGVSGPSGQGKCAFPERTDHSQPREALLFRSREQGSLLGEVEEGGEWGAGRTSLSGELCVKEEEENGAVTRRDVRLRDNSFSKKDHVKSCCVPISMIPLREKKNLLMQERTKHNFRSDILEKNEQEGN